MIKPIFRWAGGKQLIVNKLLPLVPKVKIHSVIEPFVGAGSMFLNIEANHYLLNDKNKHLINVYEMIKKDYKRVYKQFTELCYTHNEDKYYIEREKYNKRINSFDFMQAARFVYLLQTSYNGIYRVNKKGFFNVPFGKEKPFVTGEATYKLVSEKLSNATLLSDDFEVLESYIKKNDFVYCDPPYMPLTAYSLNHYTNDSFSDNDQIRLFDFCERIKAKGAFIMISNSDSDRIRELFSSWSIQEIDVTRFISCKREKKSIKEIVITNY